MLASLALLSTPSFTHSHCCRLWVWDGVGERTAEWDSYDLILELSGHGAGQSGFLPFCLPALLSMARGCSALCARIASPPAGLV